MKNNKVIVFRPYPMEIGQKIYIDGGPRGGDWEVISVSDKNVTLRCPVTHKEVQWVKFCFFVEESVEIQWPHED
ncbi:MAG: hypothetical protein KKG10_02365 [Proteobacteria bacterium]|nr:hypothetical protein [Pseudomonadota bacterium]